MRREQGLYDDRLDTPEAEEVYLCGFRDAKKLYNRPLVKWRRVVVRSVAFIAFGWGVVGTGNSLSLTDAVMLAALAIVSTLMLDTD
jgi:hypothetical protein